ncbi:MAG: DUF4011 domain-containing protein [Micrococcales bacterium]|nr:DUF4011 domain-containing protein [Micrococcales bacterium]
MTGVDERTDLYRVLDQASGGVRLQARYLPRANPALLGGLRFVRDVRLHNETTADAGPFTVTAELDLGAGRVASAQVTTDIVAPGQTVSVAEDELFDQLTLGTSTEQTTVWLTLRVTPSDDRPGTNGIPPEVAHGHGVQDAPDDDARGERSEITVSAPVAVGAANEFLNLPGLRQYLAAFVQPNARALSPVLKAASDWLLDRTEDGSLAGYTQGAERARQIAGALYEALGATGVAYALPPASYQPTGQKVRTAAQVLADGMGTCIDLTVTYAALAEAAGLDPLVVLTRGHAYPCVRLAPDVSDRTVTDDPNTIANLVETGALLPVELTGVQAGKNHLTFRKAVEAGQRHIRTLFGEVEALVDIPRARLDGIWPMAGAVEMPDDDETAADRPYVVRSALRCVTVAAHDTEHVTGRLRRDDPSPPRLRAWKRQLLDLSLRNPLLNLPRTSRVVDFVVPDQMLAGVEDAVSAGYTIRTVGGVPEEAVEAVGARTVSALVPDTVRTMFTTQRRLVSMLHPALHTTRLRALKRDAELLEAETGSNYLFLALGTLVHTKASGGEARAPLFLVPVRLKTLAGLSYTFTADGDDLPQPNLCLLEWLKATRGFDLPELAEPPTDDSGLAVGAALAAIRQRLLDAGLPYRIDETATLGLLRFSTFQIWQDLDTHWASLLRNDVVRHLVERPGETFVQAIETPPRLPERSLRLPIAADGSQMDAIVRAASGQSFVLEGPPGTGKSQTITNLVAHALGAGHTVAFVTAKQAALDVVRRRLDAVGLGDFVLELHGAKVTMRDVRAQLRRAFGAYAGYDVGAWQAAEAEYTAAVDALAAYPGLVHERGPTGHSLWSAHEAVASSGPGPTFVPDLGLPLDGLGRAAGRFAEAAAQLGFTAPAPWALFGPAAADASALPTALTGLDAVAGHLDWLGPAWRDAFAQLRPGTPGTVPAVPAAEQDNRNRPHCPATLDGFWRVLDAQAARLVATDHIAAVDGPGWAGEISAVRTALAGFAPALPDLLEAPDLDRWTAEARRLSGARFLARWRGRAVRSAVAALVGTADRAGPGIPDLLATLDAAVAARAASTTLADRARLVPGLALPGDWAPHRPGALAAFDQAVALARTAHDLARAAPAAWALVLGFPSPQQRTAVAEIRSAWHTWLTATAATPRSVTAWLADRTWPDAWAADAPRWRAEVAHVVPQRYATLAAGLAELDRSGGQDLSDRLTSGAVAPAEATTAAVRGLAQAGLAERRSRLAGFDGQVHAVTVARYVRAAAQLRELAPGHGPARLLGARPFAPDNLTGEVAALRRQADRKRGGLTLREITQRYPGALHAVVPAFLMSPGAVAHFCDPDFRFDMVIFDEASQIPVAEAIGAMGRGRSVVVVGDSKQMPPTRFMETTSTVSAETVDQDSDVESILDEAVAAGLPRTWLSWHYRSRNETLVAFSNQHYYDGRLVTLPSPGDLPGTGIGWRRVDGVFGRGRSRTNPVEAQAIVDEIAARLRHPATAGDSIGVVCFNIAQRDLILNLVEESPDLGIQQALARGEGERLFVKNLENVQGDERDTIMFSLAFSVDPQTGRLPLNFGPLVVEGGERRLNVAITRARRQVLLFSSFDPTHIDLRRTGSQGLADLRAYLEFAVAQSPDRDGPCSGGGLPGERWAREPISRLEAHLSRAEPDGPARPAEPIDGAADASRSPNRGRFTEALADALRAAGLECALDVGRSSFRVDLAVRLPGDPDWRLAVLVDGPGWASRPTVADRDGAPGLLPSLMRWPAVTRVWLPDWLRDPPGVVARVGAAVRAAPSLADLVAADAVRTRPEEVEPVRPPEAVDGGPAAREAQPAHGGALGNDQAPAWGEAAQSSDRPVDAVHEPTDLPAVGPTDDRPSVTSSLTTPADPAWGTFVPDEGPTSEARFTPAPEPVAGPQSGLNNLASARSRRTITLVAAEALAVEGPMLLARLVRHVAHRFGYSRLGARKQADLEAFLRAVFGTDEHGFVWPSEADRTAPLPARRTAKGDRTPAEIHPAELATAVRDALRAACSADRRELAAECARLLGFRPAGAFTTALDPVLDQAVAAGQVVVTAGRYRLAGQ